MAQEKIYPTRSCVNIEALGQITILLHQLNIIDLEKSLWTIYHKSGTAKILESNLKLWPTAVKSMVQSSDCITTINDDICLKFVNEHLSELNSKQQEIQQQLVQKKKLFYGYTNTVEEILQAFIEQHLQSLRLQYDYKIKFVELIYREHVFDEKFLQQVLTLFFIHILLIETNKFRNMSSNLFSIENMILKKRNKKYF